jgi:hypothetical protein
LVLVGGNGAVVRVPRVQGTAGASGSLGVVLVLRRGGLAEGGG